MRDDDRDDVPRTLHDGMFKHVFSDPLLAADELRAVLPPELVARIDWPSLAPAPTSFVDEVFRQRTSDLVFHARLRDSGESMLLWFLLEHQSTEDWWMLPRIIDTETKMWRSWRRLHPESLHLPAIVPVVVYHGPRPWRAPRDMHELYGLPVDFLVASGVPPLSCAMIVDDLCAIEDEALRARHMDAYARLCLFAMARAASADFLVRLEAWQTELRLVFGARDPDRIASFMRYTLHVHRHTEPGAVRRHVAAVIGPEHEDVMLSVAEQLIQEGFEKGIEQGREQGLEQGMKKGIRKGREQGRAQERRAMLLRVLGRRFGEVPAQVAARVTAARRAELERWFDRALDAACLDDVFASA
jgi:predicted transposase YdaD